jgi:CheY-like chemotaxis protein
VAARLRGAAATASLPILVLTARDLSSDDRERLRGRISALAPKAGTPKEELVRVIDGLVKRRAAEESRAAS